MKKTDLAYFAGIFDGEGSVTLARTQRSSPKQRPTYTLRVQVVNTNEWICQQLRFVFGGNVMLHRKTEGNHKPDYRWLGYRNVDVSFLKAVFPYLHLKRPHAELALQFDKHKTSGGYKSHEYIDIESDFKQLITGMNQRGKTQKINKALKMESRPKLF